MAGNFTDCLGKAVTSGLLHKMDADRLWHEAQTLQAEGLRPIEAARQAVSDALAETKSRGEDILRQIHDQRPQAHDLSRAFWEKETIRRAGAVPAPPLPAFVTERPPARPPEGVAPPEGPVRAPEASPAAPGEPEAPRAELPEVTPPEAVKEPLSEAAEEAVEFMPAEDRDAARKAMEVDNNDPLAREQRERGEPVEERRTKPTDPEKNRLWKELSKYGILSGKTASESLKAMAGDASLPKWARALTGLFDQLGLGRNVTIRAVNTPKATWQALYVHNHVTGKHEVLVNLSHDHGMGIPRIVLHELAHHATLTKLIGDEALLTPTELAAKKSLQTMFDTVRNLPEFAKMMREMPLREFVSEIFNNDSLRTRLNQIKPDGKISLWAKIRDALFDIIGGDHFKIRSGTVFGKALEGVIKLSDTAHVETHTETEGGKAVNSDTAALIQAFPGLQEVIARARDPLMRPESEVAPMGGPLHAISEQAYRHGWNADREAYDELLSRYPHMRTELAQAYGKGVRGSRSLTAPMKGKGEEEPERGYSMGITKADQLNRVTDADAALKFDSREENARVYPILAEMAKKLGADKKEIADVQEKFRRYMIDVRTENPASAGWAYENIKALGLEGKNGLVRGGVTKANPKGQLNFKVLFEKPPYTYAKDAAGKDIPRFLDRKGTIPNPEWAARRNELSGKMVDEFKSLMTRPEHAQVRQVILDQVHWYRDMVNHLRTSFGSFSDYVADVIAGFSPITDVKNNWVNFIQYFEGVQKGKYDEVYRKFDQYIREDPENRTASTYKTQYPPEKFPELYPKKLTSDKLFGSNTANAMMAGLDLWRAVQTGTAPKARNFGLNLIGLSMKATIDRWAARFLQRLHTPNWRIPPIIEGDVSGKHMAGEHVGLVSKDFGMGQDVFEQAAARLRQEIPEFHDISPADLQAVLWFAEKEIWERNKWTPIRGAENSMAALAAATGAQRYEAGTKPPDATGIDPKDRVLSSEVHGLRNKINAEANVIGGKAIPTMNMFEGKTDKSFDADWVVHPEFHPGNSIGHVALAAAKLGKPAAHISRVILDPKEENPNATPGLHIFFKNRVSEAELKAVVDQLKAAGLDGVNASVDPRVRPEIVKRFDPKADPNQYNGVRIQHIPEYGITGEKDVNKIREAMFRAAAELREKNANVADARVLNYDTLALKKGRDYDTKGTLTTGFKAGRGRVWTERALRAGSEATARRDRAAREIAVRDQRYNEIQRGIERAEEEQRAARWRELEAQQSIPPANDGGIDHPDTVAPSIHPDEREPVRDPYGGRASLVRSMVNRITGASRDKGGIEVPQSEQEVRGLADPRRGKNPGRKGSAPLWRSLGETFRKREASLYQKIEGAAALIKAGNPENAENPKDPARYQNSQTLLDYLSGKETPTDPGLKSEIAELRKEIPTVSVMQFKGLRYLDSGAEASVYHDPDSGVVYKFYPIRDGRLENSYVPGPIRLDRGGGIRIGMGESPTVSDLFSRMERANSHGSLTPHELAAITHEGDLVFTSPFVEGREVTQKNMRAALARAGIHFLSDLGATSGVAKQGNRWVVYDDLHPGNVRTMPGGRVEILDANNRELDSHEVADLHALEKMPKEREIGPPIDESGMPEKKYDEVTVAPSIHPSEVRDDTDLTVAPMAGTGKRKRFPWPWIPRDVGHGYERGGMWQPHADLSKEGNRIVREKDQAEGASAVRGRWGAEELNKAAKEDYGKAGPDAATKKDIQAILGNMDDRLKPAQYKAVLKISDPAQRKLEAERYHMANVAEFKTIIQPAAEARVKPLTRDKAIELRNILEEETDKLLQLGGVSPDLKARISADRGVLLHSNDFEHFENGAWENYVRGNSPEARRIRAEAEKLFKNEIIGEKAHAHQVEQAAAGNHITDAQAISYASALKTLDDDVGRRLDAYLRKTDDRSRVQMLMGKMAVDPSGEMISLDREQIPQEVKDLWGQWNEPNVNFMKTFSLLAHHNAEMQMQHALLQDGLAKGYLWKEGDPGSGKGLVPLGYGKHGPLEGYYGPPVLKEAFDNLHSGQVRDWMSKLSTYTNLSKTAGNVFAGWGHNFLGNAGMLFTNGNIPWALIHLANHPVHTFAGIKKGLWVSLMRTSPTWSGAETVKPGEFNARDEAADMVRLGVFDSEYITNEGMKDIYTAMGKGAEMERQTGSAASSLQGVFGSLKKAAMKVGGGLRSGYQMMDNFWKYVNFKMELQKQQWIHEKDATPPSLEEMKREAADATNQSLTSFNRTPEVIRRTLGTEGLGRVTGAFASFPVDVTRTIANNVYNTGREIFNRDVSLKGGWKPELQSANLNARARSIAALRVAGMIGAYYLPGMAMALSKTLWKYDDKDEEAVRNTLPDDRRDNMMVMWKRDAKGNPQYIDLGWMNPYSLQNSMMRQTMRKGLGAGLSVGLQGWTKPQPALQSVIDFASNKDSGRGGRQIWNPEDPDWGHAATAVAWKARRDFAPPVVEQGVKVYHGLRGDVEPGTGKTYDPAVEAAVVASVPRRVTVDIPQTVGHKIQHYKARMANVNKILSDKFTPKGTIDPGEVEKAYTDANAQAFEVFTELRQAYKDALTLSRDPAKSHDPAKREEQKRAVDKALVEGLGDETKKGGLSKDIIKDIKSGRYKPLKASALTIKDMRKKRPDLYKEYNAILRTMKPQLVE